jgi:prepilin-type N-terminal cleavage/methylation domain-containing protein
VEDPWEVNQLSPRDLIHNFEPMRIPALVRRNPVGRLGVTILELLAVLAIVGVLAGVAIARTYTQRGRAARARLQMESHAFLQAQEAYFGETGRYYAGPYSQSAVAAATFGYVPGPGISIEAVEESPGRARWLVVGPRLSAGATVRPICRLTLAAAAGEDAAACALEKGWKEGPHPTGGSVAAPGQQQP